MAALFPIFLKLEGQQCLVVGAGNVARQKIRGLLASGAKVRVVAPEASQEIRDLASAGRILWIQREFEDLDVNDVFLVIAATGNRAVNERVSRSASVRLALCNVVDEPEHCDFYYPAVVRRGDLQIAISTGGHSPALAQRLRCEFEALIGPEYESLLRWLGRVRSMLFGRRMDPQIRKRVLHRIASREVSEKFMRARQQVRGKV